MTSFRIALIALVGWGVVCSGAEASAIASVKDAFWQVDFAWYDDGTTRSTALPAGVVLSCTGTARLDGAGGCGDTASATAMSSSGVWELTTVDRTGALVLSRSGAAVPGGTFGFTARFASFYPAGSDSGASVDDGASESADYFTVVEGPGGFDLHGCNMSSGPGHSGPHACRPVLPEFQESTFTLGPSADWSTLVADWRIYIQVSAQGEAADPVPEPPSLALVAAALGVTACRRKVRSRSRQSSKPWHSTGSSRPDR
jgi:hypothetical protein